MGSSDDEEIEIDLELEVDWSSSPPDSPVVKGKPSLELVEIPPLAAEAPETERGDVDDEATQRVAARLRDLEQGEIEDDSPPPIPPLRSSTKRPVAELTGNLARNYQECMCR